MRIRNKRDKTCKLCTKPFVDQSKFNTKELCSPFCKKESMNSKRYDVSNEQYLKLLKIENCQLCNKKFNKRADLHIDHCHESNKIRGVLCRSCNVAIGSLGDTVEGLLRAIKYLEQS